LSKIYNLSKKSDMVRFKKDLEKQVLEAAKQSLLDGAEIDYECPNCHKTIKIHVGENVCPHCNFEIIASL